MQYTVELRKIDGTTLASDTFAPIVDDQGFDVTVPRAVCDLYQRIYPRKGGWQVGSWQYFPGGNTRHYQMTAAGPKRNPVSLEPTIVVKWREIE